MTILVPTDGSELSNAALEAALDLFPDTHVHVLHVIQTSQVPTEGADTYADVADEEAENALETATGIAAKHDREIETTAQYGHAAKTIVSFAEDNDIEYIVMGSAGRSGVSRLLMGSVAEMVVRHAPCTVMVVRE